MAITIELPDLNRHQSVLTVSDWQQLMLAFRAIRELQDELTDALADLATAQAAIADHETRIAALEP